MIARIVFLLFIFHLCSCNIHRAIPGSPGFANLAKYKSSADAYNYEEDEEETVGYIDYIIMKANVTWIYAIAAAILVGSTGILPLLIFRVDAEHELKESISPAHLNILLSFAVGGLLGDVFLHLLPESYMYLKNGAHDHTESLKIGLWTIGGFLCFMTIEKIFFEEEKLKERIEKQNSKKKSEELKNGWKNGHANGKVNRHVNGTSNGHTNGKSNILIDGQNGVTKQQDETIRKRENSQNMKQNNAAVSEPGDEDDEFITEEHIKIIGYLNLFANCIDNFTHGLAVAGSFMVSIPVGLCTTFAILLHEIPHEIGDFAILLRAGFKRWEAAKGQVITASGALFGCLFGLMAESAGDSSAWVLPFTSGGFVYISMVTIVPDLLKEDNLTESIKQIASLVIGVSTMGLVSLIQH
ncbi:zinc transporter ZIP13-like [Hydractinia symbiolongicarpus]|uniref:zinc transporter ZIP13-like n=1 Tax=Hydractinia symbiolongicarpus TaxID=13093 RepID=UPI00254E734B|nr:zinc transporter ZIP13-like [Hydractinia symbiolongicarpus]